MWATVYKFHLPGGICRTGLCLSGEQGTCWHSSWTVFVTQNHLPATPEETGLLCQNQCVSVCIILWDPPLDFSLFLYSFTFSFPLSSLFKLSNNGVRMKTSLILIPLVKVSSILSFVCLILVHFASSPLFSFFSFFLQLQDQINSKKTGRWTTASVSNNIDLGQNQTASE